ncbi:MAG: ATP synthase subunit I [Clostridiales bacterium]|nr:ATP synthase subunit I [Clostridiales bacterium]
MKVQPAVKKETGRIAAGTAAATLVMFLVFFALHQVWPAVAPFDYRVIVSGVIGAAVAVGNFFLMGLTVQRVTAMTDQELATKTMRASYSKRNTAQGVWIILALVLPVFNGAAGVIPLFFPGLCIKLRALTGRTD